MYNKEKFCLQILKKSVDYTNNAIEKKKYNEFCVPKKDGIRKIQFLDKSSELSILQYNLLNNFLNKQPLPGCVKGFVKNENYNSFLIPHIGSNYFLRIDIKSFFPSIKEDIIKRELSLIINSDSKEKKNELLDMICNIVTLDGYLPQGTCTSPTISNIVMARVDQRILKYCQVLNIKYTRYADDLLFSSQNFCFKDKSWFIKKIKHILYLNNLYINYSKLKYSESEISLNGYVISKNGIRLSRKRLHDIRKIVCVLSENEDLIREKNFIEILMKINCIQFKNKKLIDYPFNSIFQLIQYMCGYRSYIISMLNDEYDNTKIQNDLKKLISKIEKQIIILNGENF